MNLLKKCKNCDKEFEIKIIKTGRGSKNVLRKIFCSTRCRNAFNRNGIKYNPTIRQKATKTQCKWCGAIFFHWTSKIKTYCSRKCVSLSMEKKVTNICKNCGKEYGNLPNRRINQYYCSIECFHKAGNVEKSCITCGKSFKVKVSKAYQKSRCGRQCQYIDQSNGKIKLHLNGRTGYRIDIDENLYFKSALEADFARLMKYFNVQFEYEQKTFVLNGKAYTPDFYIPGIETYFELKGVENNNNSYSKMMRKNLVIHSDLINEFKINIFTITQKQFIFALKCVKLWDKIPNLEQRNYKKTNWLVKNYEDKKHTPNINPFNSIN